MLLSIVSPVYRAEKIIHELVRRIETSVKPVAEDYEIILVEDGSPDNSWSVIESICIGNKRVKGVKLSRNFGQHYAITAGLDLSKGNWVVVMDCDLQDCPEEIPNLFEEAQKGFDVVLASRHNRKDSFFKKFFSAAFYRTLGYLTGSEQDETVANFGIYSHKVIKAVVSMRESIRYFPTMVKWVGFSTTRLEVTHHPRFEGESSYNFRKLFKLALDIVLAYSDKPIRLLMKGGFFISFLSFSVAVFYFFQWVLGGVTVAGYTSLIISIWLLSGLIIMTLGGVGLYVGKSFEQVKRRPVYIVDQIVNND